MTAHSPAIAGFPFLVREIDPVCGLPNGVAQLQALEARWQAAREHGTALAVIHLQVRHLRELGRIFGDEIEDGVFRQLIVRMTPWLCPQCTLFRIGEDLLSLILDGPQALYPADFAMALCTALDGAFDIDDMALAVQVHAGIAVDGAEVPQAAALLRQAGMALSYGAAIGERVRLFQPEQRQARAERIKLLGSFCGAIKRDELRLYCQPQICIATGKVIGAETLVRWQHPTLGLLCPNEFIPLAEQSGMIGNLTSWVVHASLGFLRGWQSSSQARKLALNLSAHDIRNPASALRVRNTLEAWGVRPELVQFEITESALIDEPEVALASLMRLKEAGVAIMIDDFGTGYSSLSYLQRFPIDGIKIDRSFIAPMLTHANSAAIVHSTIRLGQDLKLTVVAEGVEEAGVLAMLKTAGCDTAQGYLFSKPMPIEAFPAWQASFGDHAAH